MLENLIDYDGEDKVVPVQEVFEEEKKNQKAILVGSGIDTLDEFIGGFKEQQVIVITGIAKRGKTTLAKTITKNIQKEVNILWFSFEEPMYEFYKDIQGVDFVVPSKMKAKNMDWIEERIEESIQKFKTKVVFIDHLHYLFSVTSNTNNVSLLVGDLMRRIKGIARDNNIIIFVLAHTKKIDGNRIPRAEDVRDSALIANECDKMLVVHRDRSDTDMGMSTMSDETKLVIELDRQNGSSMGMILPLKFEDNLLKPADAYENTSKVKEAPKVGNPSAGLWA